MKSRYNFGNDKIISDSEASCANFYFQNGNENLKKVLEEILTCYSHNYNKEGLTKSNEHGIIELVKGE